MDLGSLYTSIAIFLCFPTSGIQTTPPCTMPARCGAVRRGRGGQGAMEDRRARRRPPLDADGVRAPTPSSGSSDRHAVHQLHAVAELAKNFRWGRRYLEKYSAPQ